MDDSNTTNSIQERSSLCESESSSVANMNYSGPDLETDTIDPQPNLSDNNTDRNLKQKTVVVLFCHKSYIKSFTGMLRLLQVILSLLSLITLTTAKSRDNEGFLMLPLSWHFRVMVFVLLLSLLTSLLIWTMNATGAILMLPVNWYFIDMVLYSVFSFLYLVGTSLVASAFDFYQKMGTDVPHSTIKQLIFCVVVGYICMVMYGLTALIGYRRWRKQHRLFKRRKLLEQDDEDVDI